MSVADIIASWSFVIAPVATNATAARSLPDTPRNFRATHETGNGEMMAGARNKSREIARDSFVFPVAAATRRMQIYTN